MEEHSSKTPTWLLPPQTVSRPLLPPQSLSAVRLPHALPRSLAVLLHEASVSPTGARLEPGCQAEWGGSTKAAGPTAPLASPLVVPEVRLVLKIVKDWTLVR